MLYSSPHDPHALLSPHAQIGEFSDEWDATTCDRCEGDTFNDEEARVQSLSLPNSASW